MKVRAASVNPVDWKLRHGLLHAVMPVEFTVIWECGLAGVVREVGPSVTLFKPGDEVYGMKMDTSPKHTEVRTRDTWWFRRPVNQGRLKPGLHSRQNRQSASEI